MGAPASSQSKGPSPFAVALVLTVGLRILYSEIAALMAPHLKSDLVLVRSNQLTENLMSRSEGLRYALWGVWERFDTLWYLHIAQQGYQRAESVVFFPLYPLLVKAATVVVREPLAAALLVATAASLFLFWGLQKLLRLDLPAQTAQRALVLYALWPASFVFFAGYPDSLVAGLIVWSVYCARRGHWWGAGMLGLAAGLTKAVGALVAVPLAIAAWRTRSWRALPAGLCLAGPLAFVIFLKASGRLLASEAYPKHWSTELVWPWQTLWDSVHRVATTGHWLLSWNLMVLLVVFGLSVTARLRFEYTAFALATLGLILVKRTEPLLQSTMRYVLVAFPVFANLAGLVRNRLGFCALVVVVSLLNLYLLGRFLDWSLVV